MTLAPTLARTSTIWLCVASLCLYAAVNIGDTVAQSIFVSRLGVGALPNIFLLKAAIDVLSGLLYLPLTRERSPRSVWQILLAGYALMVVGGWAASAYGGDSGAYVLYAGHEVAWTLVVIHWGIFLLDSLPPKESRNAFPVLFGVGRLGALIGGLAVSSLAVPLGAEKLLPLAALLAVATALASSRLAPTGESQEKPKPETGARRQALASPLVRLIAASTATMVILRYGLKMVSLDEIRAAFAHDKDQVAAYLGLFSLVGNALAFFLGLFVVPRLLARMGVGVANVAYASFTLVAFVGSALVPGLASATFARFVDMPLKNALKTPLSVLFYGAERPPIRLAARSLIFGVAIPAATVLAGLAFRELRDHVATIGLLGIGVAAFYIALCAAQNRAYRHRLVVLLEGRVAEVTARTSQTRAWDTRLLEIAPKLPEHIRTAAAKAFASGDPELRSLAQIVLSEQLPHHLASAIGRATLQPNGGE